jgi:hypothetical protein
MRPTAPDGPAGITGVTGDDARAVVRGERIADCEAHRAGDDVRQRAPMRLALSDPLSQVLAPAALHAEPTCCRA